MNVITIQDYVGIHFKSPDWNESRKNNGILLLRSYEALREDMISCGVLFPDNPKTGNGISGQTFGGFRPGDCPQGASNSSHKEGLGIDLFDPEEHIDRWCITNQSYLRGHGIYIEHPSATIGWSHWTIRSPKSGHTVFYP